MYARRLVFKKVTTLLKDDGFLRGHNCKESTIDHISKSKV